MPMQRVVDAPDGAEQADEGRGAADRGEQHLAELQLAEHAVQRVAQAPRQLRVGMAAAARACRPAARRARRRAAAAARASRSNAASCSRAVVERRRLPRTPARARSRSRARAAQQPGLPEDHDPGADRHQPAAAPRRCGVIGVALRPEAARSRLMRGRAQREAEHVVHVEQAAALAGQEARRAQAALRRRWRGWPTGA